MLLSNRGFLRLPSRFGRTGLLVAPRRLRPLVTRSYTSAGFGRSKYSAEDDEKILALREKSQTFVSIGEQLTPKRTATLVRLRWRKLKPEKPSIRVSRPRAFTSEDDKIIILLRSQRLPFEQIGEHMSRSKSSVYGRYLFVSENVHPSSGRKLSQLTKADATALLELRDRKLSWRAIAAHFPGRHASTLRAHLQLYNTMQELHHWSVEEDAKLAHFRSQGLTYRQIATEDHIPGRSQHACRNRWVYLFRPAYRNGRVGD